MRCEITNYILLKRFLCHQFSKRLHKIKPFYIATELPCVLKEITWFLSPGFIISRIRVDCLVVPFKRHWILTYLFIKTLTLSTTDICRFLSTRKGFIFDIGRTINQINFIQDFIFVFRTNSSFSRCRSVKNLSFCNLSIYYSIKCDLIKLDLLIQIRIGFRQSILIFQFHRRLNHLRSLF